MSDDNPHTYGSETEMFDPATIQELADIAKSLPAPESAGPYRVVREYGSVAVFDRNDVLVVIMREDAFEELRSSGFIDG